MTEVLSARTSASGATGAEPRPLVGSRRSKSPLSPQLKIDPASEWANSTLFALDTTEEVQSTATPGPFLPGAYPYTPSSLEPGPSFEEVKDTAREYLYAAGQYVPSHEDIKKMAQNAGSTMRGYIPDGVATYLGPPLPHQESVVVSPIEESETTPTAGGGFVLINRGIRTQTQGNHESIADSEPTPGEAPRETDFSGPGANEQLKSNSDITPRDTAIASRQNSREASTDASTRTQAGSLTVSERQRNINTNGTSTPFSYTGYAATDSTSLARSDSQTRTATHGPPEHANLAEDPHLEMRGHPDGVINHGGIEVNLGPGGEGTATAPSSGAAVGPDPGPGITGQSMLQADKHALEGSRLSGESSRRGQDGGPVGRGRMEGQDYVQSVRRESVETKGSEEQAKDNSTTANAKPRTYPFGEQQRVVGAHNGGQGRTIGEPEGSVMFNANPEAVSKEPDNSPVTKPQMMKVYSSTATTGHEEASPLIGPGFAEPPSSAPKEESALNDHRDAIGRPTSLMTSPDNPHVGRAMSGPNAAKLGESGTNGPALEERHGRRKSNFLHKLKAWSKRLSQDRKAQN